MIQAIVVLLSFYLGGAFASAIFASMRPDLLDVLAEAWGTSRRYALLAISLSWPRFLAMALRAHAGQVPMPSDSVGEEAAEVEKRAAYARRALRAASLGYASASELSARAAAAMETTIALLQASPPDVSHAGLTFCMAAQEDTVRWLKNILGELILAVEADDREQYALVVERARIACGAFFAAVRLEDVEAHGFPKAYEIARASVHPFERGPLTRPPGTPTDLATWEDRKVGHQRLADAIRCRSTMDATTDAERAAYEWAARFVESILCVQPEALPEEIAHGKRIAEEIDGRPACPGPCSGACR